MNPVPGYHVTTPYKKKGKMWKALGWHTGADLAAPVGTPIVSATPGTVIAANAYDRAYGYKVIVRWGKYDVWYCHMRKGFATVKAGQKVKAGQRIGKVGDEGNVTGAHLHIELRIAGGRFAASNFYDPAIAINYEENNLTPEQVWTADMIAVENTKGKKVDVWTPSSMLTVTKREVDRANEKIDDLSNQVTELTKAVQALVANQGN